MAGDLDLHKQRVNSAGDLGLLSLSNNIQHVVGNTATVLIKPAGAETLVMHVESGTFRLQTGDTSAGIAATAPSDDVTDGTGSLKLGADKTFAFTAPDEVTVIGSGAGDILTYWFV